MAAMLFEEQFRCCICLESFTEPVSIPCGHSFCLNCIKHYWDARSKSECPLCKETFRHHPPLRINRVLRDITEQFKRSQNSNIEQIVDATFPHQNLCGKHNSPLDMFCNRDQIPVCVKCAQTDHKGHSIVHVEMESRKIKTQLKSTETELQMLIQARLKKKEEIKQSLELSKKAAEREKQVSSQVFSALISTIQRREAELNEEINEQQKAAERRANELVKELEKEISELQRRQAALQLLEETENNHHLLQSFPPLISPLSTKKWSEVSFYGNICMGTVRRAVSQLVDFCQELDKKLSTEELNKNNQYAVDVTLDPETAAAWLVLSRDGKQVKLNCQKNPVLIPLPNEPKRFDPCVAVLGKQGFTTGRRYWVVEVGDKTEWDLGVAKESINRKGRITVRPDKGYWAICRRKGGSLSACAGPSVTLNLRDNPQKVGVFLDYEEGTVSFYDVEAKCHIYTYSSCAFTEALYPYFNPCLRDNGKNISPLVICPVEGGAVEDLPRLEQNIVDAPL
ncbi:E3 ubiquitin-protein ligase TRIM39-like [Myripristis murdjan]|uniref:E3 ubiquitin-protein ligase TRIM39-like n=1 Tax=Myripristis murdjan TaxID=586833 RepID=UPI001175F624|nr:E3 ubiquitin-protein ligase TRIM39-like [Myripristis murdjan]